MKIAKLLIAIIIAELFAFASFAQAAINVRLTWQDTNNDEVGYRIQRSLFSPTNWVTIVQTSSNVTSYTDTNGVAVSTTYLYRGQTMMANPAFDSVWSNIATAVVPGPANPPVMLPITITASTTGTRLQFYAATRGNYRIEERPPNGNWLTSTTLTAKKPRQLDWLDVGRWGYEYRVYRI